MSDSFAPTPGSEPDDVPNPETGVGVGAGDASTFEPEEDAGDATQGSPDAPPPGR